MPTGLPTRAGWKAWLRGRAPRVYRLLASTKGRVLSEWRVATRLLRDGSWRRGPAEADAWMRELPVQAAQRLQGFDAPLAQALQGLRARGVPFAEGAHAAYLPPGTLEAAGLGALATLYPPGTGVKIVKAEGTVAAGRYVSGSQHSSLQRALLHDHPRLSLVAGLLHAEGLGPRPIDLVELSCGGRPHVAYLSEHVDGGPPDTAGQVQGVAALRRLEQEGELRLVAPAGWEHEDFTSPGCNGNALVEPATGAFRYVDFQNFVLANYGARVERIALEAAEATHFGDKSLLRGGRYLYQTVPGLGRPAKRNTAQRGQTLARLLRESGVDLNGRLVLDVGCNLGMMTSQYLALGAGWCHGWDLPSVVPHSEKLLRVLGCTRFSLTGERLSAERDFEADLPPWLRPRLPGCVVSYLSIRLHLGWIDWLRTLPFRAMVYEGHESEGEADLRRHVAELAALVPVRLAAWVIEGDGDSRPRPVAILVRVT